MSMLYAPDLLMSEKICKNCLHFETVDGDFPGKEAFGRCRRWRYGYAGYKETPVNEVQVENDEGWGAMIGPEFGCVLFKARL
jgi:hypothetical protein